MKRFICILAMALVAAFASAQTTKVRGIVRDADTSDPIPFAGVYFKGTTTGLSADAKGVYSLETTDLSLTVVRCQMLGYRSCEVTIHPGQFNTVYFDLEPSPDELSTVVVKADDSKIRRLLAKIEENMPRNDPQQRPWYSCDVYSKIELGITNAESQLNFGRIKRDLNFVFDYMDTSVVSGVPYLPAIISESLVKRKHTKDPEINQETIQANKISGISPDNIVFTEFTGSLHLKGDFYKEFVNCLGVEFPSPTRKTGLAYYNYYIVDSLQIEGRKTYVVHYHPKKGVSIPTLDGEFRVDANDFAIRSLKGKMLHGKNVNWIRDIVLESEYCRLQDSTWFYKSSQIYGDFSVFLKDSTKIVSLLGKRSIAYTNPSFEHVDISASKGEVIIERDATTKSEKYWEENRPVALSKKEKDIYQMVARVKRQPGYMLFYDSSNALISGYWDFKYIGLGNIYKVVSFNNLEGARFQIGAHTTYDVNKKFRFTGYLAYGITDKQFKGGLTYEHLFRKDMTRKLTVDARYDVVQLGRGTSEFTTQNIIASIFGKKGAQRPLPQLSFTAMYEHEFTHNFNAQADFAIKRLYPNYLVPMERIDGTALSCLSTNELHTLLRFSKEETVIRGRYIKTYVSSYFPILSVNLTGGIPGWHENGYGFFRPEIALDWKIKLPPIGTSTVHLDAGGIIGKVPYPLLHLFAGNGTYLLDKTAFSCMDFYEFAADSWTTIYWNHSFQGLLLGWIPGVKKLSLREEFVLRAAYGGLSDKNNPYAEGASSDMIKFPDGLGTMGKTPYVEIGCGISNILRLIRVDCIWRLTHRDEARQNFCVNVGLELQF